MLNVRNFGIALGLTGVILVVVLGVLAMFGIGMSVVTALSAFYIGYSASVQGILVGAIMAFIDGLIGGMIFATIYNKLMG